MKKLYFLVMVFSGLFISCKKEINREFGTVNKPPIANAGLDRAIDLPQDNVLLDGSMSRDYDGTIVKWKWEMISGPQPVRIVDSDQMVTPVYFSSAGNYLFEFTVVDNGGLSAKDSLLVMVKPAPGTDLTFLRGGIGNLAFYFPDPTSSMELENIATIAFAPPLTLVVVKIDKYPNGHIDGMWCNTCEPKCPISSDYLAEPDNYVSYDLPPGTYTWTAETVSQTFTGYPFANGRFPAALTDFFAKPHKTTGTVTIQPNQLCLLQKIVF